MANSEETILKEGFLIKSPDTLKHLAVLKRWQRKWFRLLQDGTLNYYESEKASRPTGVLHLVQLYRIFDAKTKGIQLLYCAGLEIGPDTIYLKAESANVYNEWIELLAAFAEVREVTKVSPGPSPRLEKRRTVGDGSGEEGILRTGSTASIQSRQLSLSTKAQFNKKEGWLAKTGGNNKGWKDRYAVLSHGKLSYFKSEKTDAPQGAIDLFECSGISRGYGKKGYGFDVQTPGRLFNMSVENEREQNEWITSISQTLGIIAELKDGAPLPVPRSGSTGSQGSLGSLLETHHPSHDSTPEPLGEGAHSSERPVRPSQLSKSSSLREDKDSVVQLLEAEVDALRTKVSSLESALAGSVSASSQLQDQLAEDRRKQEALLLQLREERDQLNTQVGQLQRSKEELETINDSLQAQLEEHMGQVQLLQDEQVGLRQDLEDAQGSAVVAEDEVKMFQSELSNTQHKLQEIEEVAHELQMALIKRGEDPQTPILLRKLSMTSLRSDKGNTTPSSEVEASLGRTSSLKDATELTVLQQRLRKVEEERDSLREEVSSLRENKSSDLDSGLREERLKWQMEMENLRQEHEARIEGERRSHSEEKAALERRLAEVEERYAGLEGSLKQQNAELQDRLSAAAARIESLEEDVSLHQERASQLQVEKEKALADLNTIRKINRTMEKKLTEGELEGPPSPAVSPVNIEGGDVYQQLAEAERRADETKALLQEVEHERNQLKTQLERLLDGAPNGIVESGPDLGDMSRFRFRSKSRATIAISNPSPSVQRSQRTKSFSSVASTLQSPASADGGGPPPKPKRPPKELMSKLQQHQSPSRNRAPAALQSLFVRS